MTTVSLDDLSRAVEDLRRDLQGQIDALSAEVAALRAAAPPPAAEEVSPELLVVMAAAVTAFLGKKVRIRTARLVPPHDPVSPWAQHGRVFVQAAFHDPRRVR